MWSSNPQLDKYLYVRTNPHIVRIMGAIGVAATLIMAIGYMRFFGISLWYALIFGPIGAIFLYNKLSRYLLQVFYPKFDIKKHEKFIADFWANNPQPSVDVFLPWAGEDLEMHEEVLKAVKNIDYENINVYMLDDKGSPEHEALAHKYGFIHLSRPNKGEHKKSGNLEYGYNHSSGEFVLILDADFIPTRNSLKDIIPYIATNPRIGILQTPQYLEQHEGVHKRSKIEFGGGNIVEDFYKITLPCRDVFEAAMCVGTSAIYRRSAISLLNGTPKVHASEDLATGLLITQHGYIVKYLPLIVSIGKSPESFQGYFKQHHRWCSGNLVFAHYWPRARMNVVARLIYLSNPTYYLSEAFSVIFSFHFLALLYFHSDSLSLANTIYFLPYIIFSRVLLPLVRSHKTKVGTRLAALSNTYTYIYTYIHLILHGAPVWHPTGVKTSKLHRDFLSATNIGIVISSTFVLMFLFVVLSKPELLGDYNNYLILGWGFYSALWHSAYLYMVSKDILSYRLSEVTSFSEKSFLYLKAYFVVALTFLLGVNITVSSVFALRNPEAETVRAIASLTGQEVMPTQLAEIETPEPEDPVVIAQITQVDKPAVQAAETETDFVYEVTSGDTPSEITKQVVSEYESVYNLDLTDRQEKNAVKLILERAEIAKTIYPGEEIIFDVDMVSQVVEEVLRK